MDHEEVIKRIKCRLLLSEPFFGHLLSSITILPHENIPKFQIVGNIIYYNKKYIEDFKDHQVLTNQLLHCLMHIAFCHFVRRKERHPKVWDKSTDIATNNILYYENNKRVDGINDGNYKGKAAENIYEQIKEDLDSRNYSGGFDIHIDTNDIVAEEQTLRNVVEAQAVAKSMGKMHGGLETLIKNLLDPKVSWKQLLRKYATECLANEDYSFINPRKCLLPLEIYCASLVQEEDTLKHLVVMLDSSGSITDEQLKEFLSEVSALHHLAEKTIVIVCDAAIQDVYTLNIFESFKDLKISGRGGTDFRPVFKYLEEHKINPTLFIGFTDGYASFPEKAPSYPVIWCLTNKTDIPFGTSLTLEN